MEKYPLSGWAVFLALVTIGPSLNHVHASRIREQVGSDKVPPIDSAFALATAKLRADERLLLERLHGWEVGSDIREVTCGKMSHYKISIHFVETIEECMSKWQKDARRFNDPAVQNSWDCFREDAEYYVSTFDQVTFLDDSGRFLDVPRE
ncbi:hypothetical protein ACTXPA_11610 [Glutamicibacter arilaitensis]|uniref:hypothetical protein n=1 Tax=Glutamicibacter arilaitensis TaxID=256701 RepID=UPI003FCF7644